jgi:hypothetical protein
MCSTSKLYRKSKQFDRCDRKDDPVIRHAENVLRERHEANGKSAEAFLKHLRSSHPQLKDWSFGNIGPTIPITINI